MKRFISILLIILMALAMLPATAFAATVITRVELTLELPVAGQTPKQNCSIHGNGYTIHSIDWEEVAGRGFLESGETFREGCTYVATVWVKAASGYEFSYADSKTPAITGYINGQEVSVTKAYEYNAWAMVCLTVQFSNIPAKGWIKNVNLSVPAPVAGEMPSYTQITGTGYGTANVFFGSTTNENMKNGIAWYYGSAEALKPGQDKFAENTVYEFHCLVFPGEGYKIREDATVYVNGKEAEAKLDYDTFLSVNYTFPTTGKALPEHAHIYSDWDWNSGQHYKTCLVDGCDYDIFFVESHKGGEATCSAKGKCSVCGYAYLEKNENHTPGKEWTACGSLYHAKLCKDCGAHCDPQEHIAGPAGTPGAAVVCRDCGYIMTPAKDHTHQLTKVAQTPATCTTEGNIEYYTCNGCSDRFTDAEGENLIPETMGVAVGALGHTASDTWSADEQFHWRTCTVCKVVLEETKLSHDPDKATCTTCSSAEPLETTAPTEATEPAPTAPAAVTPVKERGGIPWWVWVLVAAVCAGAGITTAILLVKKKK